MAGKQRLPDDLEFEAPKGAGLPTDLDFGAAAAPAGQPPPGETPFTSKFKPGPGFKGGTPPMIHGGQSPQVDLPPAPGKPEDPFKVGAGEAAASGFADRASLGYSDELGGVIGSAADSAVNALNDRNKPVVYEESTPKPLTITKTLRDEQVSKETRPAAQKLGDDPAASLDFLDRYAQSRNGNRDFSRRAAKQQPFAYGTGGTIGGAASMGALGLATGGAAFTPAGGAVIGGATGVGNSDAPLFSQETGSAMENGALLGGVLGGAAQYAPIATGVTLGVGGLGAGAFGDHLGMSPADRVEAAEGGALALGGSALSAGLGKVANKAGKGASAARGKISDQLLEQDAAEGFATNKRHDAAMSAMDRENEASKKAGLKKFEGISKTIEEQAPEKATGTISGDGKHTEVDPLTFVQDQKKQVQKNEAPWNKAVTKAGKEKVSKFKAAVGYKQDARGEADAQMSKAFQQSEANQSTADDALVGAFKASEAPPSKAAGGNTPEDVAAFRAGIPQRVQGKLDADYQAVLHRYNTLKQLGHEIPPELDAQVNSIKQRYADNSPGFFDRFLDFENKAPGYQADLEREAAAMERGGSAAGPSRDTDVRPPRALDPDTGVSAPPAHDGPPVGLDEDQAAAMKDLKIGRKAHDETRSAFPAVKAADEPFVESYNKTLDQMLGVQEPEPGFSPGHRDYRKVLTAKELDSVAKNAGVDPEGRLTSKAPRTDPEAMRNYPEMAAYEAWSPRTGDKTVSGRSTPAGRETPTVQKPETVGAPKAGNKYSDEFLTGPGPEPDFYDSPLSSEMWKKVSGAHVPDEKLSPDLRAQEHWRKQGFTDGTAGLSEEVAPTPKHQEAPSMEARIQSKVDAEGKPSVAKWTLKQAGKLGLGLARMPARLSGVSAAVDGAPKGPAASPEATTALLGAVEKAFNRFPNFYKKYGSFLAAGKGADLTTRIKFLADQDPEFALSLSDVSETGRRP